MIPEWLLKPRIGREAGMYFAYPTRLHRLDKALGDWHYRELFKTIARQNGFAPLDPFSCGDFEDWEGGFMQRADTLDWTMYMQRWFKDGWSGCGGISEGVLRELRDRLSWDSERRIRVFYGNDPLWDSEYERLKLRSEFGDVFSDLRGRHSLIQLVGPSAIGKTYWIKKLKKYFGDDLTRVRNVTTRLLREKDDEESYYLVNKDQFLTGVKNFRFLEYDNYFDEYYGSSLEEVKPILKTCNAICAMTPEGAKKWYECRFEINIVFILLKPVSEEVLARNLSLGRRGETDPQRIKERLAKAKDFVLPPEISHITVPITGEDEYDRPRIFEAIGSFIK